MKLYYSPGACSLSPHIVLRESGLAFEPVLASTKTHQLADGTDYYAINPRGYVPLLEFDNGERMTEGPAIVQYVADQVPAKSLAPPAGTMERYRLQEWLTFIGTEIHKQFGVLFNREAPDEFKAVIKKKIQGRLEWTDAQLGDKLYLTGGDFTGADAYLFVVLRWAKAMGLDMAKLPRLVALFERIEHRPAVQEALKVEGLLKAA
jgi:glutathione S-transferase